MARTASVRRAGWLRAGLLLLASGVLAACGPDDATGGVASSSAASVAPGKADCRRWTTCVPENPCHTGWVTGCRGNTPVCTDIGGWLSNGTSCDAASVCSMGECTPCAAGAHCSFPDMYGNPDACRLGAISCTTGQPVCEEAGPAPDGTACGGGGLSCHGGQCGGGCTWYAPCDPGIACYSAGYTDCSTGAATCVPQQPSPDGVSCGDGLVCSSGSCLPTCKGGEACTPSWNACATGTMSCYGPTGGDCIQNGTKPDGASCGEQAVCSGGSCLTCNDGMACPAPNPCYAQGAFSCATGRCDPSGAPFADGTACGVAGETCQAGTCTGVPGARLVVRSTTGTVDLTGTSWAFCEMRELAPQSQLRIDAFPEIGVITHEDYTYDTADCSGDPIPGSRFFATGTVLAEGDRAVGWTDDPPPFGLPSTVTATALHVTATDASSGELLDFRTLRYVSDAAWLGARTTFEGKEDRGIAPDGYPTLLVTAFKTEVAGCVPDLACDPGYPSCDRWAIDCSTGAPQCTPRDSLPAGTSCGPGMECSASLCLPAPPPVTGSRTRTWWPDAGPLPPEPLLSPINALVPQADGSFVSRSAAIQPDGSFEIAGVPVGPYVLQLSGSSQLLLETDARVLDLGQDFIGRPAIGRAYSSTPVTLELTNLAPLAARDVIQIASSNVGMATFPFGNPTIANLPLGATELTRTYDWSSQPLLDPALGDVGLLFQSASGTVPGTSLNYRAATRWAAIPGPILPGVAQTLSLALTDAPSTGQLGATWPIGAYVAHATEVSPSGTIGAGGHRLAVVASPWAAPWGPTGVPYLGSIAVDLLHVTAPAGSADVTFDPLAFGRVLPAPYVEYRDVRTTVRVAIPNPAGGTLTWSGAIVRIDPLDGAPVDAGPVVTPPLAPRLGGTDAFTPQVNVGTGPTLSWSPPALGSPTSYVIAVYAPVPGSTTTAFLRAVAKTTGTSFRFPEHTLAPGETCFATITARQDAAERPEAPLRASFDADWASLVTAPFTP